MKGIVLLTLLAITAGGFADGPRMTLAKLAAEDGIEIQIVDHPMRVVRDGYEVTADPVTEAQLAAYAPLFDQEWRRYPRTLMVRTRLGTVLLGANVRVNGQPRAAVPEEIPGWFWLDAAVGSRLPAYGKHVIHHDFYHLIDYWDSPDRRRDPNWETLNPPGTHYGTGGWNMQKGNPGALRSDLPGFLCAYATSAVEEDKAEVFSHLLTSTPFVMDRVAHDPVIARKVARIRALVVAFEPTMDDAWFLQNGVHPQKECFLRSTSERG